MPTFQIQTQGTFPGDPARWALYPGGGPWQWIGQSACPYTTTSLYLTHMELPFNTNEASAFQNITNILKNKQQTNLTQAANNKATAQLSKADATEKYNNSTILLAKATASNLRGSMRKYTNEQTNYSNMIQQYNNDITAYQLIIDTGYDYDPEIALNWTATLYRELKYNLGIEQAKVYQNTNKITALNNELILCRKRIGFPLQ